MMKVCYKGRAPHFLPPHIGHRALVPGVQEIPDDVIAKLHAFAESNAAFGAWLAHVTQAGQLDLRPDDTPVGPAPETKPADLARYSAKDAKRFAAQEPDLQVVARWLQTERRQSVRLALQTRLDAAAGRGVQDSHQDDAAETDSIFDQIQED